LNTRIQDAEQTVGEYLEYWLKAYALHGTAPNTYKGYKSIIFNHVKPSLGHVKLNELRPRNIQDYFKEKLKTLSVQSVKHHHRLLTKALNDVIDLEFITHNVALKAKPHNPFPTVQRFIQRNFGLDHDYPVFADAEVLVVGGGAAGVAAAETASRHGCRTIILEKYGFCGGAMVAGLFGTVCGMYLSLGRKQVKEYARFLKNYIKGCESSFINDTGVEVGIRQTRTVTGVETLTNNNVIQNEKEPTRLLDLLGQLNYIQVINKS
jgi:hypothetical protein